MNTKFKVFLSVAIVVAIAGLFFPRGNTVVQQVLGAVSSLDGVDSPSIMVAGKREWKENVPFNATSSVLVSWRNPLAATSTVTYLSCESTNVGIPNANNLFVGTTTVSSRYATTTTVAWNQGFPMGTGQWSFKFANASSTLPGDPNVLRGSMADGASSYILGPNDILFAAFGTSTAGTFATYDVGSCNITLEKI